MFQVEFQVEFQDLSNPQEDGQLRAAPPQQRQLVIDHLSQ